MYRKRHGRPKKKGQGGAAPAQGGASSGAGPSTLNTRQCKKSPAKPHGKRGDTKTSQGDGLARLTSAVEDWDALVASGKSDVKKMKFAEQRGIEPGTFGRYACGKKGDPKRRKLGAASGRKALLTDNEQQLLVDSIRRRDRGNEGMSMSTDEVIDMVRTIKPGLTHKQAESQVHGLLRRKHSAVLTKKMVVPQATTTKRSAITPEQQYRWHEIIDRHALEFMRVHAL